MFGGAGRAYIGPRVVAVDSILESPCGTRAPSNSPAGYCRIDGTIYYTTWFFTEQETRFGNYAWVNILAHEWGHHAQNSLGLSPQADNTFELQADCLAGAYARDAATRGLLDPGDVTEAVIVSAEFGDDPLWPQDQPGAHGTNDERIASFMRGYLDGFLAYSRAARDWTAEGPEVTIYGQEGSLLLRVTVVSNGSDPVMIAQAIVELVFR